MDTQYDEYQQELEKVQDKDFIYNWVSSSAFIFYLSVFCLVAFFLGSCLKLYSKRFENSRPDKITIQGSTLYTPKYSTPK